MNMPNGCGCAAPEQVSETQRASTDLRVPSIDVFEGPDAFRVRVDLPGVRAQDVVVDFESGILNVRGTKVGFGVPAQKPGSKSAGTITYERSLRVGESIDTGAISAEYHEGMLEMILPKAGAMKPRAIPVVAKSDHD